VLLKHAKYVNNSLFAFFICLRVYLRLLSKDRIFADNIKKRITAPLQIDNDFDRIPYILDEFV
jgi:hypothetical protein